MRKSVLIIAGEKSGEEHAQSFLPQLKEKFPDYYFWGVGGNYFQELNVELIYNISEFSTMGFTEAIARLPFYIKAKKKILEQVSLRNTQYAILIDFQGFNLNLAKGLFEKKIEVLYFVAPQAWAWKAYRAKVLAKVTRRLFCILPFEKHWFESRGVKNVTLVEHPVLKKYRNLLPVDRSFKEKKQILFLPGSRKSEINELLPMFITVLKAIKSKSNDFSFAIVQSDSVGPNIYEYHCVRENFDNIYESTDVSKAMLESDMALAASGTVTLMTGVFLLPTVVCYRVNYLNEYIYKNFISYDSYVSLTNIISAEEVFPELLGEDSCPILIEKKLSLFFEEKKYLDVIFKLKAMRAKMLEFENPVDKMSECLLGQRC
jgi:lipid-A-disaccharide synthase